MNHFPGCFPRRRDGPHVDDDSEWYVVDHRECLGQSPLALNPETVVVSVDFGLASTSPDGARS